MKKEEENAGSPVEKMVLKGKLLNACLEIVRKEDGFSKYGGDEVVQTVRKLFKELNDNFQLHQEVLSTTDRLRFMGIKVRNHGFVTVCYDYAREYPQMLPNWLPLEKFKKDYEAFERSQAVCDMAKHFAMMTDDEQLMASDTVYHDALAFYNNLQFGARQRMPGVQSLVDRISPHFKRGTYKKDTPTQREVERDARSLLKGTKEGFVLVENTNTRTSGGRRRISDMTRKDQNPNRPTPPSTD